MIKKLSYEEVKTRFNKKGFELLDKEYASSQTRMSCVDKDGYKYFICNNSLQNGSLPEKFNKFNPYTLENIKLFLKLESNGSKLITKEYKNSRMNLEITCEDCGKVISKKWGSIINDKSFKCIECINKNNNQRYNFDYIKNYFKNHGFYITDTEYKGNNIPLNCIDSNGYRVKISYSNLKLTKRPNSFSLKFNKENYINNINQYFKNNNINCMILFRR